MRVSDMGHGFGCAMKTESGCGGSGGESYVRKDALRVCTAAAAEFCGAGLIGGRDFIFVKYSRI
ncbi:MAG: hypothetical protein K2L42_04790 [Clostridia bacterium]|nr:hypothetical protein [Clostridia bacterium]